MSTEIMANTQISLRIDADLKAKADSVLTQLGLSTSDFARMALHQLVLRQGLPFDVKIPNAATQAAIDEPRESRLSFSSVDEMMAHIDAMPDEDDDA